MRTTRKVNQLVVDDVGQDGGQMFAVCDRRQVVLVARVDGCRSNHLKCQINQFDDNLPKKLDHLKAHGIFLISKIIQLFGIVDNLSGFLKLST